MRIACLLILVSAIAIAQSALAQGPSGEGRRFGPRGPMTQEEIQQRMARMEDFLRQLDTNKNGMIDAEEVSGGRGRFIEGMLSRAGIEPKYPIPISTIRDAMTKSFQARLAQPGGGPSGGPGGPAGVAPAPALPGFGDAAKAPPVAGFIAAAAPGPVSGFGPPTAGPPPGPGAPGATPGLPSAAPRPADSPTDPRFRALAVSIIQKNDKNGDGKLDRGEWPAQDGLGTFDEANRFGGNFVTVEELTIHLADLQRRGVLPSSLAAGLSPAGASGPATGPQKPRSGRFLTPAERLPKGLPEWFLAKDVGGRGQITMAEFASEWTPEAAAEFDRYDLNHDGIITAAEVLKVEARKSAGKQSR
ncbi:MAG: hypothetical protein ABR915_13915 [Thermoguttaceae bacterium]|jgi:hypothetical protein